MNLTWYAFGAIYQDEGKCVMRILKGLYEAEL